MTQLITCSNARWLPRVRPYLETLANLSPWDNVLAGVACRVPSLFLEDLLGVRSVELPPEALAGAPAETQSVQHGSWLPYITGPDDQVVIFTDGDIVLQRRPSDDELAWIAGLPEDVVTCGWNSGPRETLADEGARLFPKVGPAEIVARFGAVDRAACYNIGVIAARRSTWRKIHALYMRNWPLVSETFGHAARQQWLVCWVLSALDLRVDLMPQTFHTHGCYPLPAGSAFAGGELHFNGTPVLFRHHV